MRKNVCDERPEGITGWMGNAEHVGYGREFPAVDKSNRSCDGLDVGEENCQPECCGNDMVPVFAFEK